MANEDHFNWQEEIAEPIDENDRLIAIINNQEYQFNALKVDAQNYMEAVVERPTIKPRNSMLERTGMSWGDYRSYEKKQLSNFFTESHEGHHPLLFSRQSDAETTQFLARTKINALNNFESCADRLTEDIVNKLERASIQDAFEIKREMINDTFHENIIARHDRVKSLNDALQDHMDNFHSASHDFDNAQQKHYEATLKHDLSKDDLKKVYLQQIEPLDITPPDPEEVERLSFSAISTLRFYYTESTKASTEAGIKNHLEKARKKHIDELTEARSIDLQSINPQTGEIQTFKRPSWRDRLAGKVERFGATIIADKIRGTLESSILEIAEKNSYLERQENMMTASEDSDDADIKMRLDMQRNFEQASRELEKYKQTKLVSLDSAGILEFLELKIRNYEYLINMYIEKIAQADVDLSIKRKRLLIDNNKMSFKNKSHPMHGELLSRVTAVSKLVNSRKVSQLNLGFPDRRLMRP